MKSGGSQTEDKQINNSIKIVRYADSGSHFQRDIHLKKIEKHSYTAKSRDVAFLTVFLIYKQIFSSSVCNISRVTYIYSDSLFQGSFRYISIQETNNKFSISFYHDLLEPSVHCNEDLNVERNDSFRSSSLAILFLNRIVFDPKIPNMQF